MSNSLTGNNPTSYLGVRATQPPQMITMQRAPTTNDVIGYQLGTQWLYYDKTTPSNSTQYTLASVAQGVATWVPLNGGGDKPIVNNHAVAIGTGVPGLNSSNVIATVGAPLVSNGTAADPSFGVASVSGGGTGLNACAPYSVYCGGTTGEGPVQQVAGLGTAGQILTSNGNGSLPTWQAGGGGGGAGGPIAVQVFPSSGTYVPTAGMGSCVVECIGGGGGGGSIAASIGGSGGGGAGGYVRKLFSAATIGASQAVVIGAGGAATVTGGNTTFLTLTASGGVGGGSGINGIGAIGGAAAGGDVNIKGGAGGSGCAPVNSGAAPAGLAGFGGSNLYGSGGLGYPNAATDSAGSVGNLYGGGGSGAVRQTSGTSAGGAGANGVVIVTEYGPYGILPPVSTTTLNYIVFDTPGAGTYTPTSGMYQVIVECVGGGGGVFPGTNGSAGAGGYCKRLYSSVEIGVSKPYVVGVAGIGGRTSPLPEINCTSGGDTTFGVGGTLMTAGGGGLVGGSVPSGLGGTAVGGNLNIPGQAGGYGNQLSTSIYSVSSAGGNSMYGFGGNSTSYGPIAGLPGTGYGGGGGGIANTSATVGMPGSAGVIIITEYIS